MNSCEFTFEHEWHREFVERGPYGYLCAWRGAKAPAVRSYAEIMRSAEHFRAFLREMHEHELQALQIAITSKTLFSVHSEDRVEGMLRSNRNWIDYAAIIDLGPDELEELEQQVLKDWKANSNNRLEHYQEVYDALQIALPFPDVWERIDRGEWILR